MDHQELKTLKEDCLRELREYLPTVKAALDKADTRLYLYASDAIREDMDTANVYELLGIRKILRLMLTYEVDVDYVHLILRAIEGVWEDGKHVRGGLSYDTPRGYKPVRLMPYQVWCVFGIYAFFTEVCMEREYYDGMELLPSEFVKDGMVWDRRRLCR